MGLDMYLNRKNFVKNSDFDEPDERYEVIVKRGGKVCENIQADKISHVEEQLAYWRKANAIHKWFVDNVQDGVDECQETAVSRDDLQDLLDTCKAVKADPSKVGELLPPASGFFFGSTNVDEWYWQAIDYTIERLEDVLSKGHDDKMWETITYSSSW